MGDRGEQRERDNGHRRHSAPEDGGHDRPTSGPGGGYNKRKREYNAEPRTDSSRLLAAIFRVGDAQQVRADCPNVPSSLVLCACTLHPCPWSWLHRSRPLECSSCTGACAETSLTAERRCDSCPPCLHGHLPARGCPMMPCCHHVMMPTCRTQVRNIILDCALELSPKTPVYATLVGELALLMRTTACSPHP